MERRQQSSMFFPSRPRFEFRWKNSGGCEEFKSSREERSLVRSDNPHSRPESGCFWLFNSSLLFKSKQELLDKGLVNQ